VRPWIGQGGGSCRPPKNGRIVNRDARRYPRGDVGPRLGPTSTEASLLANRRAASYYVPSRTSPWAKGTRRARDLARCSHASTKSYNVVVPTEVDETGVLVNLISQHQSSTRKTSLDSIFEILLQRVRSY